MRGGLFVSGERADSLRLLPSWDFLSPERLERGVSDLNTHLGRNLYITFLCYDVHVYI